jgi:hypothetical protein
VAEIPLTRGAVALIDVSDLPLVEGSSWCLSHYGYATSTRGGRPVYMHKVILPVADGLEVDHVNRDRLDNRRSNLRPATRSQQRQNAHRGGSSQFTGVTWHKRAEKWMAHCNQQYLGLFVSEEDAARAHDAAAVVAFGEFARLNFEAVA